jgi:hypothetical protein
MKLAQLPEAHAFSETRYATSADKPDFSGGIMISGRPFNDATVIGRVVRNAAPNPEVSLPLSTMKTNMVQLSCHSGQEPPAILSGKAGNKVACKPDAINDGNIEAGEMGHAKERFSGEEAPAKQDDTFHLAPMVMLRHQAPVLVRRYFRDAGHPTDRSGKNSHPDTLRIVRQGRIRTGPTRSGSRNNQSGISSILHRKDIALRKDPYYTQAGKSSEIEANGVNAVSTSAAEFTRSTEDGEVRSKLDINSTLSSPPVCAVGNIRAFGSPFTGAGNAIHAPLILTRKSAVHDSFQDNDKRTVGVEIAEKPDVAVTQGSGMPNFRTGVDIVPFNTVSGRRMIQTAPTNSEPHFLLQDVRPFAMRKITSFFGTPLTKSMALPPSGRHDSSFNGLRPRENPSYEACGDSQHFLRESHINPKSESFLMRHAMNSDSSPVTAMRGKATPYLKEQTESTSNSVASEFTRSFSGDDAVKTASDGSSTAPDIRGRFRTELPLVKIERNLGLVLSKTVTGRLKGGIAAQNVLRGFPKRSPDMDSEASGAAATPQAPVSGPGNGGLPSVSPPNGVSAASVNMEKIADEVYAIIERRLIIEKERRGL